MADGDTITNAWQTELRGVLLDAQAGCEGGLVITEWWDGFGVPQGRVNLAQKPLRHGLYPGPQYMDGRTMVCAVRARANTWAELRALMMNLGTAFSPVEDTATLLGFTIPMIFTLDDLQKYRVYGIPTRAEWGYQGTVLYQDPIPYLFADQALCEFLATDPLIYANDVSAATIGGGALPPGDVPGTGNNLLDESNQPLYDEDNQALLDESTGGGGGGGGGGAGSGLGMPHDFPHGFGALTTTAAVALNGGNAPTFPTITITAGPTGASGIELTNGSTGESWSINLAVPAGNTLVIDMAARLALLNATADRSALVVRPPSTWFALRPGLNSIALASVGDGTTALIEWRDAYLL